MKVFIATTLLHTLLFLQSVSAAEESVDPQWERDLTYEDCSVAFRLYNSKTDEFVADIPSGGKIVNPTPNGGTNIEAVVFCSEDDYYSYTDEYDGAVAIELFQGSQRIHSRTEQESPYFLFGNGEYSIHDGTIPNGAYRIRARVNGKWSPFTKFTLVAPGNDCAIAWHLFDSQADRFVADVTNGVTIAHPPPCGYANIEAVVSCDDSDAVTLELYQGSRLVQSRMESELPYFLYGNGAYSMHDGKIKAGRYGLRAHVNGKWSPFTNFTLGGSCGQ